MHSKVGRMVAALLVVAAPLSAHDRSHKASSAPAIPIAAKAPVAVVDAFHAALRRGDLRTAAALVADDALIFEGGGAERTKSEYVAHHLPADAAFSRGVSSIVTWRTAHSNGAMAWVASEGRTTGSYKGKALDLATTETMLLRRTSSGWKIVHVHWSSASTQGVEE